MNLPPKIQNQLTQFEQVRQQLQLLTTQRIQVESQIRELENALGELNKSKKNSVIYRKVGAIFVKVDDKKDLKSSMTEQMDTFGVRMKTLERQEKQLKERYSELQKEISKAVQSIEQ
ncbi:prefoldin subunit beta [[Eubacterium] cellulosolvens]